VWEEGIRESITNRSFIGEAAAGAIPYARQSRQSCPRSILIFFELPSIPSSSESSSTSSSKSPPSSSPPPQPPSILTPQHVEAGQEEDDHPGQRAVRQGVDKRAVWARELIANKYEKRHEITKFKIGNFCTI
jgi:hypothetical protein